MLVMQAELKQTAFVLTALFNSPAQAQTVISGDNNNVDDRDQANVCRNVVNIFVENVQNPTVDNSRTGGDVNVDNDQVVSGDGNSNEQVVLVSNEQVVDIAQELNISPVIVQQCIQQNAGRDIIVVSDSNDDNDNDNSVNDVDDEDPIEKPSDVLDEITTNDLPNTGGSSFFARGSTLVMVFFGMALLALPLIGARRERE